MQTLEEIKRRIKNTRDLKSIVHTMKILAAVSIRQYERAEESLVDYNKTIEMGLQVVLKDKPAFPAYQKETVEQRTGAIILGSDQGLCGQFNEVVTAFALAQLHELGVPPANRAVMAIGAQAAVRLEASQQPIVMELATPASVSGIKPAVQQVLLQVERWRNLEGIGRVYLFYNRILSGVAYRPQVVKFLPIDIERFRPLQENRWPSRGLPIYQLDLETLLTALLDQYLFVVLYRAFANSLAAENASRLMSMQVAERNIDDQLVELQKQFHHQRQNAITDELLDVVSGFEILTASGE